MRLAPAGSLPGISSGPGQWVKWSAPFALAGVASIMVATRVAAPSLALALGIAAGVGATTWMFFSERMEGPLIALLLYLGLLDGFLKLRTNSSVITLGRDVLLYSIVLGFLARAAVRRRPLRLPPFTGYILAFVVVVLVQVANPANQGLSHTLGALRPHLEFVPLFFIGYGMLQTPARLRTFFVVMLVIATANGIVGTIQLNLSPAALARWGPGYAFRINGNGTGVDKVSGRTFGTTAGVARTRPFGLGDDSGVGEGWGMLALGGALALLAVSRRSIGWISALLCAGPPLAIITGEGRSLLIGSIVALIAYVALATSAKRLMPTLMSIVLGLAVIVGVVAYISSVSGAGVFDRYATISPSKLTTTANADRGASFAAIPTLFVQHPLGNGLGSVGPAAHFAGGGSQGSNGETEPGFLLSELGIPGLVVVYAFMLQLLFLGTIRIRRFEPETRAYVAALLAGLAALLVVGISAATTATAPFSPYLWFVGGALSYWLTTGVRSQGAGAERPAAGSVLATR